MLWLLGVELLNILTMGYSTAFVLPNSHSGESLELLLANLLGIHHSLHTSRICDLRCVQFYYILLEWVAYFLYDSDEKANIFLK